MTPGTTTIYLQGCLDRLRAGDPAARNDLLRHSQGRLRTLTRCMLARYPGVHQLEQTDDVLQNVLLRLNRMLDQLEVASVGDYLRLAATNIRRELIDLRRHYFGPRGIGANEAVLPLTPDGSQAATRAEPAGSSSGGALSFDDWTAFHESAAHLPDAEREALDLLFYHGLTEDEAARVLAVSVSTVKRRWQAARVLLMERLGGMSPV
jgi:RNA polymerase sigma-70 factor (ECF subfamily)